MLDGVKVSAARDALAGLPPVLQEAREPVDELFGDPVTWARDQQDHWRQSGTAAYDRHELLSALQLVRGAAVSALCITVAVTLVALASDGWTTSLRWTTFALPLLLSAATMGALQVWTLSVRRVARPLALVLTAGFVVAVSLAGGGLATAAQGSAGTGSVLWYLAPAPFYLLVYSTGLGLGTRGGEIGQHRAPAIGATPHAEWLDQLREQLRRRDDLSERQIRTIVDETRAHATDAGASYDEEFGTPESYAATFPPDTALRERRAAWGWTAGAGLVGALVVFSVVSAESLPTWQTAVFATLLVASLCYAVQSWRRALSAQSTTPPPHGGARHCEGD